MTTAESAVRRSVRAVARANGLPVVAMIWPRGWPERRSRHLAAYLAVTAFDVPRKRVARAMGVDMSGLSRALAAIEDRRDCPLYDERLRRLEAEVICDAA